MAPITSRVHIVTRNRYDINTQKDYTVHPKEEIKIARTYPRR
jgi:hypothetical protein